MRYALAVIAFVLYFFGFASIYSIAGALYLFNIPNGVASLFALVATCTLLLATTKLIVNHWNTSWTAKRISSN